MTAPAAWHANVDTSPAVSVRAAARARVAAVVCLAAALLVLPPVGRRLIATGGINGDDEARYALMARDTLQRGVWFDLHVRGERTWEKPPLLPWLIAGFARLQGDVTEATAQAPIALATIAAVLFTFLLGEQLFGPRAGLWAALILLTSYDFFGISQYVLPDMLVVAFATLAGWAFSRWITERSSRWALPTFWAVVGFAVFAKGPLGLLPLVSATGWLWTEHGVARGTRCLWSPIGIGLFTLITLAWLGPFLSLGAKSFAEHTVWGDWLTWYFGLPNPGELAYTVTVGFLPWTILVPLALGQGVRAWRTPAVRLALLWFALPFLILGLAAHQKMRYSLSIYPGAALLVAWWADAHGVTRTLTGRILGWIALAGALATAVALHVPAWWHPQMQLYLAVVPWSRLLPVVAGLGLIGIAICWGLQAGRPALLVSGAVAGMAIILGNGIWPYTTRYNEVWNFKEVASRSAARAPGGEFAVFVHRLDWLSLDFYSHRSLRSLATVEELKEYVSRADHPVVIMDRAAWQLHQHDLPSRVRALDRITIGRDMLLVVGDSRQADAGHVAEAFPSPTPPAP